MIFAGFLVLMLRSLILFGRGFSSDPNFGYWVFDGGTLLGQAYGLVKDCFVVLVVLGTVVFLYYRLAAKPKRMSLSVEALVILGIILVMMGADVLYDGAHLVIHGKEGSFWEPLGSVLAMPMRDWSSGVLKVCEHVGFWTHTALVLVFLNLLPHSKHFHVITAVPNAFFGSLDPPGRLPNMVDLEGMVEREETLGIKRIDQFGQKAILDFYTCTECGRCTDYCPANRTGKLLSPKQLTIDLRNFLYKNESALIGGREDGAHQVNLTPDVIKPEVLWACTTCRACEEECPVLISFVDKIVDMRRYLVQEGGEFPEQLQNAFRGMETTGSPYNIGADERMNWAEGLEVPMIGDNPEASVIFWVGCAPAFDNRAKKVTQATAKLMKLAGVDFACLGPQEQCTGDPARRAGNEFLFQTMARANVETLNGYGAEKKTIVTVCPHCFNTLANEYGDFEGHYKVVHHSVFLSGLVREGKLKPTKRIDQKVTFHDSCYLGRFNNIYESPRETLASIPGLTILEPAETRDRGMCCGAGGAQMWKEEEQGDEKVNFVRTNQLVATGAEVIASACPFCMRMLSDGINLQEHEGIEQKDIAELLLESVEGSA